MADKEDTDESWVEIEVGAEKVPTPEVEKEEKEVAPQAEETPPVKDSDGPRAEKRIKTLWAKTKDLETALAEERKSKEDLQREVQEIKAAQTRSKEAGFENYKVDLKAKLESAQKKFKDAYDTADRDGLVEANMEIADAMMEMKAVAAYKVPAPETKAPPAAEVPRKELPLATRTWVERSPWFNKDKKATAVAVMLGDDLLQEGFSPDDPEFYQELDKRIVDELPRMKIAASAPPPRQVSGQSPSPRSNKVKLTREEVETANNLGVSLEKYAKRKVEEKDDNGYTNIATN